MNVVYTTIFGGSDSLKPAPKYADRAVCFVDDLNLCAGDSKGWTLITKPKPDNPRREAWHLRCIPHILFPDAERTIWIDASFTLTDLPALLRDAEGYDISGLRHHRRSSCYEEGNEIIRVGQGRPDQVLRQLDGYRRKGFKPKHLSISCILVRSNVPQVEDFNTLWDAEINEHQSDNTQLSLDYSAWVNGLTIHGLQGGRKDNPYSTHDHNDHKKRRKPYDSEVAA